MGLAKVTILGSGTSTGVPVIGCDCAICTSENPKNKRFRSSIMLTNAQGEHVVVDTTPDFRMQMLNNAVKRLSTVLYTHLHADHCHGFDDLRAFSFYEKKPLTCYLKRDDIEVLKDKFAYAFQDTGYPGAKPQVELLEVQDSVTFSTCGLDLEAMFLPHGEMQSVAYRCGGFAYATDFKHFSAEQIARWRGQVKVMVASGIHFGTHSTHSTIPETLELFKRLQVEQGFISHLSHKIDHIRDAERLPANVALTYDGMTIDLAD